MVHSEQVSVRELRQNLSVYLRRIATGETLEVTDRGRPVAVLAPLRREASPLDRLKDAGLVTAAKGDLLELRPHQAPPGMRPSEILDDVRADRKL